MDSSCTVVGVACDLGACDLGCDEVVSLVYTLRCVAADDGTERSILVALLTRALTHDASDDSTSTMDAREESVFRAKLAEQVRPPPPTPLSGSARQPREGPPLCHEFREGG